MAQRNTQISNSDRQALATESAVARLARRMPLPRLAAFIPERIAEELVASQDRAAREFARGVPRA